MATLVTMPKLSDTMEEGGISSWLIEVGSYIEEGDPLAEIETDKASMEYASPASGYLLSVLVQAGEHVPLASPIAVLGKEAGETFDLNALQQSENLPQQQTPKDHLQQKASTSTKTSSSEQSKAVFQESSPDSQRDHKNIKASPLAKKLAQSLGLDLALISGSGPGGRIVKRDIASANTNTHTDHRATTPYHQEERSQKIALSMMRKSIAKNLTTSKQQIPHFYLRTKICMDQMIDLRAKLDVYAKEHHLQQKITVNDLFVWGCAHALKHSPAIRSSWQEDYILQTSGSHIAIAVAVEDGLVTPVLSNADSYGLLELSAKTRNLIRKAQDPQERSKLNLNGGNFTISNLGMSEVHEFSAVINPGQSAILAIGKMQRVPSVMEQKDASSEIQKQQNFSVHVIHEVTVTLSCDHRVVDGMQGARFLESLKMIMEDPVMVLK